MTVIVEAMLCESGTEKDLDRSNMAGETKWDGTRIWAGKQEGKPFIINRKNVDYTNRLLEVTEALSLIPSEDFILDGEAVWYDGGRTVFEGSQRRCATQDLGKQRLLRLKYPIVMETFDIIHLDGKDLRDFVWQSRKHVLEQLIAPTRQKVIKFTEHAYDENIRKLYNEVIGRGEEGLILKSINSKYVGRRSRSWLKVKKFYQERCKVVGFTEGSGKRGSLFGSLVLAKVDDFGRMVYCGKVGSGFSDAEVRHIAKILAQYTIDTVKIKAVDATKRRIPYTPVEIPLEVTVKFFETSKNGVFRFPSLVKDERGSNLIHYNSDTIKESAPKQSGLLALLNKMKEEQ